MLIPTGGFGWVAGEDRVAPPGASQPRSQTPTGTCGWILIPPADWAD